MRKALMARHLRGMEVGCGKASQCVWLPYPHHEEAWCAGVDFLWDTDYQMLISRGDVRPASEVGRRAESEFRSKVQLNGLGGNGLLGKAERAATLTQLAAGKAGAHGNASSIAALLGVADSPERVMLLHRASAPAAAAAATAAAGRRLSFLGGASKKSARASGADKDAPLSWLPLGGFRTLEWRAPFPRRLEASLRAPQSGDGLGLSDSQVHIVKTCLKSLATSRE